MKFQTLSIEKLSLVLAATAAAGALPYAASVTDAGTQALKQAAQLMKEVLIDIDFDGDPCDSTTFLAARAATRNVQESFALEVASCVNLSDPDERDACMQEARDTLLAGVCEVIEQRSARREVCKLLGGGAYDPDIDPDDFVEGIDHPYLPFAPGTTRVYEKLTDEGLEVIEVTVTGDTVEILGVECTEVRDTVTLAGVLVEDTLDWFAQDQAGNVWYFGEISLNFEDGELADIEGSWEAGVDGAKPGIVMPAVPTPGVTYRQEFLLGEAEDLATVLATNAMVTVPFGAFVDCLQTEDFTPLSPGHVEHKFYAIGVGLVLELNPDGGARTELVAATL